MTLEQKAKQWIQENSRPSQGPCLIPKDGTCLPSCHENDFCECELKSAHIAGYRLAIEDAAKRAKDEKSCFFRDYSEWETGYRCACDSLEMAIRALGASEEKAERK